MTPHRSLALLCVALTSIVPTPQMRAQQSADPKSSPREATERQFEPPADDRDMIDYVSPQLGDAEAEFMHRQANRLPARIKDHMLRTDRDHYDLIVVEGTTGRVHYNRPDLAGRLEFQPDTPLPGDEYPGDPASNDPVETLPHPLGTCGVSGIPFPGCYSGSGAYRRIFTPPVKPGKVCPSGVPRPCGDGYTSSGYWNAGTVSTGCLAGNFVHDGDINDAGFSYLGGWSPTPNVDGGTIDAGLQYNWQLSEKSGDDYSLFIKIPGVDKMEITKSTPVPGNGQPKHLDCYQQVATTLEFHVTPWSLSFGELNCIKGGDVVQTEQLEACGTVALIVERGEGGTGNQYTGQAIVWLAPNAKFAGWGQYATSTGTVAVKGVRQSATFYWPQVPCEGCIFKWMTSIAQETEDLADGAHFTATWKNREIDPDALGEADPEPGASVPMEKSITRCSEYPLWDGYSGDTVTSDCANTPKTATGLAATVQVKNYTVSGETDTITLNNP
jgi:hypothetical protein